ncbi:hypothetical protein HOLleu_30902 [Holothuria leucospilota]|uniref:Uncharacterized protein n=1 Tax=Holothuria leucospilota TaxID=206669 RepID=A0A9Q1BL92_HOLLE|nr:hypothetical protein HOLleu_30902 [Holothuria leucospilota]
MSPQTILKGLPHMISYAPSPSPEMCMASYLLHSNNKLHTLFQQLSIKYFKINIIILLSSLILKYKKNLDVT